MTIKWSELTPEQKDRIIAEKVMNWQEKQCDGEHGEVSGGWFCTKCGREGNWGEDFYHAELPPRYTTSLDAAWLGVERVTQAPQSQEEALQFRSTRFMFWFEQSNLWTHTREEAANALCVAALRACGVEVEA